MGATVDLAASRGSRATGGNMATDTDSGHASTTRKKTRRRGSARPPKPTPDDAGTPGLPEGQPGSKISMREVARLAKVSVATVSMVLNDNPRISRATHMRVQRLIDRLGYRPNRLAPVSYTHLTLPTSDLV